MKSIVKSSSCLSRHFTLWRHRFLDDNRNPRSSLVENWNPHDLRGALSEKKDGSPVSSLSQIWNSMHCSEFQPSLEYQQNQESQCQGHVHIKYLYMLQVHSRVAASSCSSCLRPLNCIYYQNTPSFKWMRRQNKRSKRKAHSVKNAMLGYLLHVIFMAFKVLWIAGKRIQISTSIWNFSVPLTQGWVQLRNCNCN